MFKFYNYFTNAHDFVTNRETQCELMFSLYTYDK
jgi:hypothetical protein